MKNQKQIPLCASRLPLQKGGKHGVVLLALLLGMGIQPHAHADTTDGLVAHWSFDDCTAKDNSGNGHDGSINGNPQCVEGVRGKALTGQFDISSNKLSKLNKFTDAAWMIFPSFKYNSDFFENYPTSNEWHLIVGVYDGKYLTSYVDGIFNKSTKIPPFGRISVALDIKNEIVDDYTVYSRTLSEAEIKELYSGGAVVAEKPVLVADTGDNGVCSVSKTAAMQVGGNSEVFSSSAAEVCSNAYPVVKVESALSKITDKVQLNELQKLLATDVLNEFAFSTYPTIVVDKYNKFLAAEKSFKPTVKNLYSRIEKLNKSKITLQTNVLPRKMPKVKALQEIKKINSKLAEIGNGKTAAEIAKYKDVKKQLEAASYAKGGGLAKAAKIGGGVMTAFTTGMAIYEMAQDFQNIREGKNIVYDSAKLGWNLTNATGGVLTLTQMAGLTSETAFSNVLSKSAAFLLIPQVVAAGYKWGQETYLLQEWNALQSSHQSMLDLRYLIVDTVVDELAKVQTTDELTDRLYSILRSYPHDSGVKTLVETFDDYLNNTGFLKRTYKKSTAKELTDLELAEVATVYALGDVAVSENIKFRERAKLERFTEFNFLGGEGINVFDVVAGALQGKDAYQKQLDFMNQVNTLLKYDEIANLRDRFDSSFNHKFIAEFRKLGEQVYYYEKLGY